MTSKGRLVVSGLVERVKLVFFGGKFWYWYRSGRCGRWFESCVIHRWEVVNKVVSVVLFSSYSWWGYGVF